MATSNTGVIVKRSFVTAIPPYLEAGELAYSYVSNTFFIGTPNNDGVLNVGGQFYTQTIDSATSTLTPNTLVKRDANGQFYGAVLNNVSGLTPGYYGGQTAIPVIRVSANGLITAVSNSVFAQPDTANLVNGAYKVSLDSVGALNLTNQGVVRNAPSSPVNIVSDNFAQLQWTTDVNNPDPNSTANVTNWAYISSSGFSIENQYNSGNTKGWYFLNNGDLQFPDNTLQNTAFTGTAIDQVARDLANNSSSGSAVDQYARDTANSSVTGSAIDQYARNRANTDVTNVSLLGSSVGSSTQIPVIGYAANGRIISTGVASPQIGTGSVRGVLQLNDSVSSTSDVSGANAATPLAVKTTYDYAQDSFNQANIASTLAQSAFDKANTAAQGSFDQYARDTANAAASNITVLQGVNSTQNNDISVLYATNLTQNNSITTLQGVDNTQNSRITSVENLVASSYNQANAAYDQANVGVTFINTGGTISGNVSFAKNVTISGNLNVLGNTTTISVTELMVDDPLLYLGANNYTSDAVDIGIIGNYNDGINAHTGIFRDPNLKEWIFFKGYTPEVESNNLIDINHSSFRHANVYSAYFKGNLVATNATVNGLDLYNYVTSAYAKGNTVGNLAQASFDVANTSSANTIYTRGVDDTQNTNITSVNSYATSAYGKANSANVLAQAAFDKANTAASGSFDQYARDVANTASANTIYTQGVDATQNTNITTTNAVAAAAFDKANSVNVLAQASFNVANTDVTNVSLVGSSVGSSTQIPVIGYAANGRIVSAGVASPQTAGGSVKGIVELSDSVSSSLDVSGANAATPLAVKTTFDFAQAAYNTANTASSNTVYAQGINDTQNTNITIVNTFAGSAFNKANLTNVLAQAAFDTANTAAANTIYTQGVDNTQNNNISTINTLATGAYNKANSANVLAQAAFDKANNSISADQYARDTANTASANTIYTQGVDETQNTNITNVNTFAGSAFDKANSVEILAQAGFDKANTKITINETQVGLGESYNVSQILGTSYDNPDMVVPQSGDHAFAFGMYSDGLYENWMQAKFSGWLGSTVGFRVYDAYSDVVRFKVDGTGNTITDKIITNSIKANGVDLLSYTQSAFSSANIASSNTIYIQGVNDTQNTNITSVNTFAGSAFNKANSANALAQAAFDKANTSITADQYARDTANSAAANTVYTQGIDLTQNTNITTVTVLAQAAFDKANTGTTTSTDQYARDTANTASANTIYTQGVDTTQNTNINIVTVLAQAAFDKANTGSTSSTDQYARDTANSASSNTIYTQGVDVTQNTNINIVTVLAQAAFDKANTGVTSSIDQYARDTANSATSNITIIQGVNTTQNTNISSANNYAFSAFSQANAAFTAANNRVLKTGDTITGSLNVNSNITSTKPNTGSLLVIGGVGVSDSIYVGNRVGFSNTSNVSMVYQYYNAATNSLDTVFG